MQHELSFILLIQEKGYKVVIACFLGIPTTFSFIKISSFQPSKGPINEGTACFRARVTMLQRLGKTMQHMQPSG